MRQRACLLLNAVRRPAEMSLLNQIYVPATVAITRGMAVILLRKAEKLRVAWRGASRVMASKRSPKFGVRCGASRD
jgi:hypothetical protein